MYAMKPQIQKIFAVSEFVIHLRPVNQNSNQKMKKIFSLVAVSAMVALVACGPSAEEIEKQKQDSIRKADSIAAIEAQAKKTADSLHMVDSLAQVEAQRKMDSARIADSIAAADKNKGGSKPKAPKNPETPKVGGTRPGANK